MKIKGIFQIVTMSSILVFTSNAFAVTADDVVCTKCIHSTDIAGGAVTSGKIAGGAVKTAKIQNRAVTAAKIDNQAITAQKIAPNAVKTIKIQDGAVTSAKIVNGGVTNTDLGANAVNSIKIQDNTVTTFDITNGTITYLDTNVNSVQRRVDGECGAGSSIRLISNTGAVTCEVDNDTNTTYSAKTNGGLTLNGTQFRRASGFISITGQQFVNEDNDPDCNYDVSFPKSYGQYNSTIGASCDLVAGVNLPDRATLTSLSCYFYDNSNANVLTGVLRRVTLGTIANASTVYETAATVDSTSVQTVTDTTTTLAFVDNSAFAYYLNIPFSTTDFMTLGSNARVYGCRIGYSY